MRYDNEEWCKVWNWTDLSIQNWYETFNEFSLERSKMSKNCTLMGWLWPKYIRVRVQRRYVLCHSKLIQSLKENWLVLPKINMRNFANFRQSTWKSTNWDLGVILLSSWKRMSLTFTGELCVMTMNNDANTEEELTCQFKIDMRNLTNFDPSTRKSQKFAL